MALTNSQIANRIAAITEPALAPTLAKYIKGSNFGFMKYCLYELDSGPFQRLADVFSYSTRIALLVYNRHSRQRELWLTPEPFSSTTARHKSLLRTAARTAGITVVKHQSLASGRSWAAGMDNRCTDIALRYHVEFTVRNQLEGVTRKGLHESTRRDALLTCIRVLEVEANVVSFDLPPDYLQTVHPITYRLKQEALQWVDTMQHWLTMPLPEMRAAAEGALALMDTEKPRN